MKIAILLFVVVSIIVVTGCVNPSNPQATPIGKGTLNLCIGDPTQSGFWQKTDDILWSLPGNSTDADRKIVARFPACDNLSATIWESRITGDTKWDRITLLTPDGQSYNGWSGAGHMISVTNETGTEWSENYSSIVGRWDQSGRGNGPKIWYEFTPGGAYTYNYDMMGNRETIQDRGSWVYVGNKTYDLISNTYGDHRHIPLVIDPVSKIFTYGSEYSGGSTAGTDRIFTRE